MAAWTSIRPRQDSSSSALICHWQSPALSPDGLLASLFDPDENLQSVYELQSGQRLLALPASPVLMGAAFSPDGLYLAYGDNAASFDSRAGIW